MSETINNKLAKPVAVAHIDAFTGSVHVFFTLHILPASIHHQNQSGFCIIHISQLGSEKFKSADIRENGNVNILYL